MTLGEKRIRTDFNVSGDTEIDHIKKSTAQLIDYLNKHTGDDSGAISDEQGRLVKLAQTSYEEAAMWAVKAITYK